MSAREEFGAGTPSRRTVVPGVRMLVTSSTPGTRTCSVIVDGDESWVIVSLDSTSTTAVRMTHLQAAELEAGIAKARAA